jgi:hypothetical protein
MHCWICAIHSSKTLWIIPFEIFSKAPLIHSIGSSGESTANPMLWDFRYSDQEKSERARSCEYDEWRTNWIVIPPIFVRTLWSVYRWVIHVNHKCLFMCLCLVDNSERYEFTQDIIFEICRNEWFPQRSERNHVNTRNTSRVCHD